MYDLRKSEDLNTSEDISSEIHFLYVQVYIQYLVSLIYCKLLSPSMLAMYSPRWVMVHVGQVLLHPAPRVQLRL